MSLVNLDFSYSSLVIGWNGQWLGFTINTETIRSGHAHCHNAGRKLMDYLTDGNRCTRFGHSGSLDNGSVCDCFFFAIIEFWLFNKTTFQKYRFGRKIAMLIGGVPISMAWIIIGTAEVVPLLYVARMLCGLTYGLCYTVVPIYLGEIASDRVRGALTIILTIMMKLGVLLAYVIGPYVAFRVLPWINLIAPICFMISIYWLPETPYYLLSKNNPVQAQANLVRLRGHGEVHAELDMMSTAVMKAKDNNGTFRELLYTRGSRRAVIIILGLASIQILCGSQAIIAYSETIFTKVGSELTPSTITIIFGSVQLVAAGFSASVVDLIGRRPLLLVSVAGTVVCNFLVGLFFYLERQGVDIKQLAWLPILAMMVFIICYVVGMATVIFALLGEIFPTNLKSVAGAVYTITSSAFSFGVHKMFQVVSDGVGSDASFWAFALFGLLFMPFIWFMVPETKGKPLDDILVELNAKKSKSKR